MRIWDWTCVILVSQFHRIESEMFNLMCTCHDHEIQINDVYNIFLYYYIWVYSSQTQKDSFQSSSFGMLRITRMQCVPCNCIQWWFTSYYIFIIYIYNYLPIISGWNDQLAGSSSIGSGVKLIVCLRRGVDGPPTFWAIEISSSEGPRSSCCGPHSF